ncbi:MAG: MMPL family transporter [Dehalococcoidia bacterium]
MAAPRPGTSPRLSLLRRIARWCFDHRRVVAASWASLLVGLLVLGAIAGGSFRTQFRLPGAESQDAIDILEANGFADRTGADGQIVFEAEHSIDDPAVRAAMEALFARIEAEVAGVSVASPYEPGRERQVAGGRRLAYAEVHFADRLQEEYTEAGDHVKALVDDVDVPGLRIELGGDMFADWAEPSSEAIGLAGATVILLVAFGSLLAMALPIMTALFGLGTGFGLIQLTMNVVDMPDFTTPVAAMISIGVGIDYALLIVTRYRQGLHDGLEPRDAVELAMDTAGRSVLFAGTTVVLSILGLFFMGLDMIWGMAIGVSLSVLMTMLAAATLVPAALGFAGRNIDRIGLPHRLQAGGSLADSMWHRWSRTLQRHPWPAAVIGVALLVALAAPVFTLRLGFADAGNRPGTDTTRRAYDLLSEGFGPGFNGPLLIATELPNGPADLAVLTGLSEELNATPGVVFASPPIPNEAGTAAIIQVVPEGSPQDQETSALVNRLRETVVPGVVQGTGLEPKVGGMTAGSVDFSAYTGRRLPVLFAAVLALSFVLLMAVFRSVLVPLKAIIMNLLSIGAAYGVMVAVFQWGWGAGLVGVGKEGPVEAWVPMMLFAIVFGLSMDYEVFLLSRIREEYDRTGDNGQAVADGLAATARVISAAAAIMVVVFASFVLSPDRALKMAGLGLAVAIAVDATVVRLVLVPATMELLGDRNWWLPRWLDRTLPTVHVEVRDHAEPALEAIEA